jgi:hypothetical protein
MISRTPWESGAESPGTTDSERCLTRLARKAFLSLWSYSNLFTDEGRSSGKGDGKELCDLLVVFGNNVLLFSDKHCEFPSHPDINISWPRWYRRAIEKSVRQLSGAERFLKTHPARVYLDKKCKNRLPVDLPAANVARYFLIAVTRGSYEAAKNFWGGDSSGSLMLDNSIVGDAHYTTPFRVGYPSLDSRFIHVFDEMTVEVLLDELDTVPDLVAYLGCKEAYFSRKSIKLTVAGEEQLIARYMCTMKDGKHALPDIPDGTSYVALVEGDWEFYSVSPQRSAKKAADAASYVWDSIIEYQSAFIRAATATSLPGLNPKASDHERVVRALADESRLSRRQLAAHLGHALTQSAPGKKFARVTLSGHRPDRAYVFLTAPRPEDVTYEQYRAMRSGALLTYCHGVKLRFPWVRESVGIACEPVSESGSSQDFLYVELDDIHPEQTAEWQEAMMELDVLQSQSVTAISGRDREFPVAFNFSKGTEFYSAESGMPMNRAARRAMAKRAQRTRP